MIDDESASRARHQRRRGDPSARARGRVGCEQRPIVTSDQGCPARAEGRPAVHPGADDAVPLGGHRGPRLPDVREHRQRPRAVQRCLHHRLGTASGDPHPRHRPVDRLQRLVVLRDGHRRLPRHQLGVAGHRGHLADGVRRRSGQRAAAGVGASAASLHRHPRHLEHLRRPRPLHRRWLHRPGLAVDRAQARRRTYPWDPGRGPHRMVPLRHARGDRLHGHLCRHPAQARVGPLDLRRRWQPRGRGPHRRADERDVDLGLRHERPVRGDRRHALRRNR